MTTKFLKSILALAMALPISLSAQVNANRATYPDYSDDINPDWNLIKESTVQKRASRADGTRSQRP